jgi:uncharacterized protein YbjT (DUF2867 family)
MKITIIGSLGNVSRRLAEKLVAKGHQVTVVSHSNERIRDIKAINAIAAIGMVKDFSFLIQAFKGADAVYTMVPPDFTIPDYNKFAKMASRNYAKAIEQTGVKYVVNLSGSGSPVAGVKPLEGYHNLEEDLDELSGINIVHLRPGRFYTNFYSSIGMIKQQGIIGNNFEDTVDVVMSHPHDIADAGFEALDSLTFKGRNVKYIVSDKKNGKEIAQILGNAIGKPDLRWVRFSDEQLLNALVQNGYSKQVAQNYLVDSGIALREGVMDKHFQQYNYEVFGRINLESFAKEFAFVYEKN